MIRLWKRGSRLAVWGTFLATLAIGCNPITTAAFLLQGERKIATDMPLRPHFDANGEAKSDIKIAILCQTPGNVPLEFAGFDRQLASLLAKKFPEIFAANGCKEKIKVLPQGALDQFFAAHPQARIMNPADIGRQIGADYVFDITISGLQMYEPGSARHMYQGRADVNVDVYDATRRNKDKLYSYPIAFSYPEISVRDADAISVARFKQEFTYKLAETIVLKHIDHKPSEGIATTRLR